MPIVDTVAASLCRGLRAAYSIRTATERRGYNSLAFNARSAGCSSVHAGSVPPQMSVPKSELCETNMIEPPVIRGTRALRLRDWRARRFQNFEPRELHMVREFPARTASSNEQWHGRPSIQCMTARKPSFRTTIGSPARIECPRFRGFRSATFRSGRCRDLTR